MKNSLVRAGIIGLPAILIFVAGWADMPPSYSGLHKLEWGYFLASLVAITLWLTIIPNPIGGSAQSTGGSALDTTTALSLVAATAFGIACNAWFFESRLENITYWALPIIFLSFALSNNMAENQEKSSTALINSISIKLSFSGLTAFIAYYFIEHLTDHPSQFSNAEMLSERLPPTVKQALANVSDPIYFLGLLSLILGALISAYSFALRIKRIQKEAASKVSAIEWVLYAPVLLLPTYYFLRIPAGQEHEKIFGFSIINLQLTALSISLTLALLTFTIISVQKLIKPRPESKAGITLFLAIAAYSATPVTSDVIGNLNYTIFWISMILTVVLSIFVTSAPKTPKPLLRAAIVTNLLSLAAVVGVVANTTIVEAREYNNASAPLKGLMQFGYENLYDSRHCILYYSVAFSTVAAIAYSVISILMLKTARTKAA